VIQIAAALAILFTGLIIGASGHLMLTTTRSLAVISEKIRGTTDKAHATSDHLEKAASTVSQSATDQAAAVAESVATLSEIEAMVAQSVQHARNSADQAKVSHTIATEGQEVMGELRLSMKAIESSMATISDEARSNSERMKSIVQIFDQISQKTTMINDIVFQTKLLSFNASIEAARAGEHGRGFTVVAEEIGNLAQVSGKAAKEIHSLLLDSQRQVNEITQGLRERLDHTVDASFTRIRAGMKISERCDAILEDVVSYTSNVENLMNSIAQAAHEQSDGVRNITAAMSELDRVIHSNSAVAQETLRCSQGMTQVASQLHECTVDLQKDIFGQSMLWTAALDPGQATEPEHDALPDDAAPSENEPLDAEELPRSA
jgi:methyl-accepting chemotaxis protein